MGDHHLGGCDRDRCPPDRDGESNGESGSGVAEAISKLGAEREEVVNIWALFPIFLLVWVGRCVVLFFWYLGKGLKQDWPKLKSEIRAIVEEEREKKRERKMRDAETHEDVDENTVQTKRNHDG